MNGISSRLMIFLLKNKIKGKNWNFLALKIKKVYQELDIYVTENKRFIKVLILFFIFLKAKKR